MNKKLVMAVLAALVFSGAAFADKIIFTEAGVSYGNIIDPAPLSDNDTGVFDTAVFDAKAGIEPITWVDIYAGAGFSIYLERPDLNDHYTFFPFYLGARVNIFPEWEIFPFLSADAGFAPANRHSSLAMGFSDDRPWTAFYYNFGIGASWKITDVAILCLSIERPSYSHYEGGEIHVFETGLAWKILY